MSDEAKDINNLPTEPVVPDARPDDGSPPPCMPAVGWHQGEPEREPLPDGVSYPIRVAGGTLDISDVTGPITVHAVESIERAPSDTPHALRAYWECRCGERYELSVAGGRAKEPAAPPLSYLKRIAEALERAAGVQEELAAPDDVMGRRHLLRSPPCPGCGCRVRVEGGDAFGPAGADDSCPGCGGPRSVLDWGDLVDLGIAAFRCQPKDRTALLARVISRRGTMEPTSPAAAALVADVIRWGVVVTEEPEPAELPLRAWVRVVDKELLHRPEWAAPLVGHGYGSAQHLAKRAVAKIGARGIIRKRSTPKDPDGYVCLVELEDPRQMLGSGELVWVPAFALQQIDPPAGTRAQEPDHG